MIRGTEAFEAAARVNYSPEELSVLFTALSLSLLHISFLFLVLLFAAHWIAVRTLLGVVLLDDTHTHTHTHTLINQRVPISKRAAFFFARYS